MTEVRPPTEEQIFRILTHAGLVLGVSVDRSDIQANEYAVHQQAGNGQPALGDDANDQGVASASNDSTSNDSALNRSATVETPASADPMQALKISARRSGLSLNETQFDSFEDAFDFVRDGCPLVLAARGGEFVVVEGIVGRKIETSLISDRVTSQLISRNQLKQLLSKELHPITFVAKKNFECDSISSSPVHRHSGEHSASHHAEHPEPFRRFMGLLNLDRRDVWTVILFALISGILAMATPLAVESLVNVVSWGTYLQPLVVLGLMLLTCLGFAGVLKVLQTVVVEMVQRRQFVRIVNDLSHRFPRANQTSLQGIYPREFANRLFDVMTIQKATAILLLDGVSIALTTVIGLLLLAFYHPFLLGFDIVLVFAMISITWVLGRGGVRDCDR